MLHGLASHSWVGALRLPFSLTPDLKKVNGKLSASLLSPRANVQSLSSLLGVECSTAFPSQNSKGEAFTVNCRGHSSHTTVHSDEVVLLKFFTSIAVTSSINKSTDGRVWIQHLIFVQCQQLVEQNLDPPQMGSGYRPEAETGLD